MKPNHEFEIPHLSLQLGLHEFTYVLGKDFFDKYTVTQFSDPKINVHVELEKNPQHLFLKFTLKGSLCTNCDRCGSAFELPVWDEYELIIKWVNEAQLSGDDDDEEADIVYINKAEHLIDISDWLYEYTVLSVPMQNIHPAKADGTSGCDEAALKLLAAYQADQDDNKEETNTLKEQLNKLKIKK